MNMRQQAWTDSYILRTTERSDDKAWVSYGFVEHLCQPLSACLRTSFFLSTCLFKPLIVLIDTGHKHFVKCSTLIKIPIIRMPRWLNWLSILLQLRS